MEEGAREVFYKGTNSIHKGTTLRPNYVPKVPPPNNITLGIRILTREFDGGLWGGGGHTWMTTHTNIQTTVVLHISHCPALFPS